MKTTKTGWTFAALALPFLSLFAAPSAEATTLDVLIATNGTVTQGDLVFSGFSANILGGALSAANVDVTPIVTASGAVGLRFTGTPAGSFSQNTAGGGGGGARETIVDVGFTVTVNGTSSRIHAVQQALDPNATANNNAVINDITTVPPSGTPIASLFSCIAGTGLPSGSTSCATPKDSATLVTDATSLIVDRQIQIIVGQKGGATVGDASTGFFDVAFLEVACAPLSSVTAAVTGSTTLCAGGTGGTASVTNTGGGVSSEQWGYRTVSGGAITAIPGQTGSTYSIRAADFPGAGSFFLVCTTTPTCGTAGVSNQVGVTINPAPATPTITGASSFCAGSSITLTSSSATGNLWSTGATTQSITVSAAGSYTVTVTDANGCQATSAAKVVTSNPLPATPTITGPGAICAGASITLTSSSATGNLWSTGATTQSITVSAAGSFTVTVTDANGCQATSAAKVVTASPAAVVPTITGPSSFCAGSSITLTSSSLTGNLWSTGATTQSITVSAAGSYTVTVTDANGCQATSAAKVVTSNPLPATPTITGPGAICAGASITLTSSSASGNLWSTGATTQSITVAAAGSYTVTVTDANGCQATSVAKTVTSNPAAAVPTITGPSAFCAGSTITLTSSSATGNLWSTGATTQSITVSAAGSYTVTVTDANGCLATSAAKLVTSNPLPATPTITGPSAICAGASITLTSSATTGNLWSTGATTQSITVSAAGSYTVTVTDANGCQATSAARVVTSNPAPATPTITGPSAICAGSTITLTSSSATGNLWSTGATTQSITVSAAGSYTVTVTDANGCQATSAAKTVTANPATAVPTITGPSSLCAGSTITLTSSSATGNLWSTGATTQSITVSVAGSYTVTVTDANGCQTTSAAKVVTSNPLPATPTITGPSAICAGASITLTSSSATGNLWSTGATTQSIIVSAAGSYTVTVAGANGCQATSAAKVVTSNPAPATPTITGPSALCAGSTVTLTSSATTGNLWSTGATTQSIAVSAAGSYTVTVTDANGCQATSAAKTVTANPAAPVPTITGPSALCAGSTIALTSSSATGNLWSTGATTQSIAVSAAGSYTVTVTDASGCQTTSAAKLVTSNPLPPTPTISGPSAICSGVSVTLTSSAATGNLWSTGATTQSITISAAGSYSVTVTDANGCQATSAAQVVTANATPAAPLASNNGPICEGSALQLTASVVAGASYTWTGPNGFISASQLPTIPAATAAAAGTYSVTATVNGCTSPAGSTIVIVSARPAAPVLSTVASVAPSGTFTASVPPTAGSSYAWSVVGGALASANGSSSVTVTAGAAGTVTVSVVETNAAGCTSPSASALVQIVASGPPATSFWAVSPCRVIDTRSVTAPSLAASASRSVLVAGQCGIPATAKALSINVTVVPTVAGFLTVYPGNLPVPGASTLNFRAGIVRAVNAMTLLGTDGTLGIFNGAAGTVDVIVDVNGFFQ